MIRDILRFNDAAKKSLPDLAPDMTLIEYLRAGNYSDAFVKRYDCTDGSCHLVCE